MGSLVDSFGDRMKAIESAETSRKLMPGVPIYARLDGRCFSAFTKTLRRPYDTRFASVMDSVCFDLLNETGALIAYTQSDEISLCWYHAGDSQPLFGGKVFKMTSVLASIASASFMRACLYAVGELRELAVKKLPTFDCRVFSMPTKMECANMFLWREQDATKNAISSAAAAHISHKRLQNVSQAQRQELLWSEAGINFNDYPDGFKRGRWFRRETYQTTLTQDQLDAIPEQNWPTGPVTRSRIVSINMPIFTKVTNRIEVIFDKADPITKGTN